MSVVMSFDIWSQHTWVKVVCSKHYNTCRHYSPPGYRKEAGGTCAITSPSRPVICVRGCFGGLVLLVNRGNFLTGAGSEGRGVPMTVDQNISFMTVQLISGCSTYSEDNPRMTRLWWTSQCGWGGV